MKKSLLIFLLIVVMGCFQAPSANDSSLVNLADLGWQTSSDFYFACGDVPILHTPVGPEYDTYMACPRNGFCVYEHRYTNEDGVRTTDYYDKDFNLELPHTSSEIEVDKCVPISPSWIEPKIAGTK